jgi:hypothetical protein
MGEYDCMTFSDTGTQTKKGGAGVYVTTVTKGYGSSAATSVLTKLLEQQTLRAGDGMFSMPESRTAERLFGESGRGRSQLIKFEFAAPMGGAGEYDPAEDSCLDAFVRLLASRHQRLIPHDYVDEYTSQRRAKNRTVIT